jgi:hypothetical protein
LEAVEDDLQAELEALVACPGGVGMLQCLDARARNRGNRIAT